MVLAIWVLAYSLPVDVCVYNRGRAFSVGKAVVSSRIRILNETFFSGKLVYQGMDFQML